MHRVVQVNDVVIAGGNILVSCSSDTTLKDSSSTLRLCYFSCYSPPKCNFSVNIFAHLVYCRDESNTVASGGLGGEVFIWDLEAALVLTSKTSDAAESDCSNGVNGLGNSLPITSVRTISSGNSISESRGYVPSAAKGHKESVYALGMNDYGTLLVSGGTEKAVRVWDPTTGSKTMKLRGHTDNGRALLLDSTGRGLESLSSRKKKHASRLRSVWALASSSTFSHVYSGGRDRSSQLYLTDLAMRESILLCTKENPILQLALHDDSIWVATTDSAVHKWPVEGHNPQKVPVYKEPSLTIPGTPGIVQHEILSNRRHVLTKDTAGSVKLWEITRGVMVKDYGEVSFEEKKKELFEMVSIPALFTVDARLGSLSVHLCTPQCFSAEMYSIDLNIIGKPKDDKDAWGVLAIVTGWLLDVLGVVVIVSWVNLAREILKRLFATWLTKRRDRFGPQASVNGEVPSGKDISARILTLSRAEVDGNAENDSVVYPLFEFSTASPPPIIPEGSQGGPRRKKITDFDGTEDEKFFPFVVSGLCVE
ncbi:transducin/WD40 repeat-like superfamily protein [Actinidia rufa]|uniref:Transducin/WD40 repeat-like superfamily protein n=1 Tax=Actinidia rufa TaxID=165716 RepID=A0A7J0F847_9ERIC|nr:transducin/WD40 repeat-like superfamily protein [Actinidia rufa]